MGGLAYGGFAHLLRVRAPPFSRVGPFIFAPPAGAISLITTVFYGNRYQFVADFEVTLARKLP